MNKPIILVAISVTVTIIAIAVFSGDVTKSMTLDQILVNKDCNAFEMEL